MYSVALVQNQSEMSHYGYADARTLLDGYAYRLFTGDNIRELPALLARRQFNALVLGSNALNDKDILQELANPEFAACLGEFLAADRGFLCLQQIGLAMRKGPTLSVLPEPFGTLLPKVLSTDDDALRSGRLAFGSTAAPHVALVYPEVVDPEEIRAHACAFRSLPGLYWHYWDQADAADWDQLIVDPTPTEGRSLVLAARESVHGRIVVSALPLDWQKQRSFFRNLLSYVAEGRHTVATVDRDDDRETLEYVRQSLYSRWIPFGQYTLPTDLSDVNRNVRLGIHSTLLLGPGLRLPDLPAPLLGTMEEAVGDGRLRVIDIGDGVFGVRSMNVVSRELRPRRLLLATELQLQVDLRAGYIDDSFWSHVETLQTVEQMPDRRVDYGRLQEAAFAITRNHDRAGSYDEIFGPTCAYYWLRARYLGVYSIEARQTESWLRRALFDHEPPDRALAYLVFAAMGRLAPADKDDLDEIVRNIDLTMSSESELLQYLRAALAVNLRTELIATLVRGLADRQSEGGWIDVTTTAITANALLDAHGRLRADPACEEISSRSKDSARAAVIVILRALAHAEAAPEVVPYRWEGKARTTTKCLQAWLKFDALHDVPVFELLESLERASQSATRASAGRDALTVLQEVSEDNVRLRRENADLLRIGDGARRGLRTRTVALAGAAVGVYILATVLVGSFVLSEWELGRAVSIGFVSGWGFHSGLAGLLLAIYGVYQSRRRRPVPGLGRSDGKHD
jgi:hypothetical protein